MIPFHRPSITEAEIEAAARVLRSGWLTSGPEVERFEDAFADTLGVQHALAVNSGTAALHLALVAYGIRGSVVVPTYAFASAAAIVLHAGAELILADVGEDYLLGPEQIAAVSGPALNAVIPVHFAGRMVDVDALHVPYDAKVIEDCAHATPERHGAGTKGNAGAFSFYATKALTTGEGGMLVLDDEDVAMRAYRLSNHGMNVNAWGRDMHWDYDVTEPGFKYNMSDIAAAIGLVQLSRLELLAKRREHIAERYEEAFTEADANLITPPMALRSSWHLYVIRVRPEIRDKVIRDLAGKGIGTSVHFRPLHMQPAFAELGYRPGQFPMAERLYSESISLPIWPGMTDSQVDEVASAVIEAAT